MVKKISKDNDIIFNVILKDNDGNPISLSSINSISYKFYTDGSYNINVTEITDGKIYIPSSELNKLNSGILKYSVHIALDNEHFSDGTQDINYHNKQSNIYIK